MGEQIYLFINGQINPERGTHEANTVYSPKHKNRLTSYSTYRTTCNLQFGALHTHTRSLHKRKKKYTVVQGRHLSF